VHRQEAVAVGVCANLRKDDLISSNHRGHGHYLAKGGNLNALIAELYCRETGCSKGRGGSMHIVDVSAGHLGSSSIVGGGIPTGTGHALAMKMQGRDAVSAIFFGDGASDEGVLYESLNFAVLKRLPVIYVFENNQYSVCSRTKDRRKGDVVFHSMPGDLLHSRKVDGNSVLDVYEAAGEAIKLCRSGAGPAFIECLTYRMRGHAGAGSDAKLGYRTEEEIAEWEKKCPVRTFREILFTSGDLTEKSAADIEKEIEREIDAAFEFAQESPLPLKEDVGLYLFRE